jgi:hypothetical protein
MIPNILFGIARAAHHVAITWWSSPDWFAIWTVTNPYTANGAGVQRSEFPTRTGARTLRLAEVDLSLRLFGTEETGSAEDPRALFRGSEPSRMHRRDSYITGKCARVHSFWRDPIEVNLALRFCRPFKKGPVRHRRRCGRQGTRHDLRGSVRNATPTLPRFSARQVFGKQVFSER